MPLERHEARDLNSKNSRSGKVDIPHKARYSLDMKTSDESESASLEEVSPPQPFRIYNATGVGPAIRQYREEAGLTQEQLAKMAGLNRTYLSDLEQGKETEQLRRVLRLLKLLGVRATLQKADW